MLKQISGLYPQVSDPEGWDGACNFAFLTSSCLSWDTLLFIPYSNLSKDKKMFSIHFSPLRPADMAAVIPLS